MIIKIVTENQPLLNYYVNHRLILPSISTFSFDTKKLSISFVDLLMVCERGKIHYKLLTLNVMSHRNSSSTTSYVMFVVALHLRLYITKASSGIPFVSDLFKFQCIVFPLDVDIGC